MPARDAQTIGARIAKRRHQLDLTQNQLADALGVSPSTVANWERGVSYPARKLGKVEQVLGVNLTEGKPMARIVDPHTRKVLRRALPDDDDYRRVIGMLEGTVIVIEPAEDGPVSAEEVL